MIYKLADYINFGGQLVSGWRLKHERWIAELREADLSSHLKGTSRLTVLDLANGQLQPQYKILRAQGHHVYGIDKVNRPKCGWRDHAYVISRWLYTRKLELAYTSSDHTLICGDVSILPFRNESFDLVTSVAAFEHFLDVPAVLKEMCRVIRPGGFAWVLVHLFASLSGGHNVRLSEVPLRTIPCGIDPWDHLRRRRLPFHVPLNEWRRDQYIQEFGKHFEVLKHYCAMREGEHLLSPAIEKELSKYSRHELTCGSYVIVAKRPH